MIREIYAGTESGEEVNIYYDKPIKLVNGKLMGARIIGTVNAGILPAVNPQNSPATLLIGIKKKPVKTDDNIFEVITWPKIQDIYDKEGFKENTKLINDEKGLNQFGGSAYFVRRRWLNDQQASCLYMARDRDIEEDGRLYPGRIAIYHGKPELKDGKFTGVVLCEPNRYYFTSIRHDASPVSLDLDTDSLDTENTLFVLVPYPETTKYSNFSGFEENSYPSEDCSRFIDNEWYKFITRIIRRKEIQEIWDSNKDHLDWEEGEWIDPPYVREVYCTVVENGYEIDVYAERSCGSTDNIQIGEIRYNGKTVEQNIYDKVL